MSYPNRQLPAPYYYQRTLAGNYHYQRQLPAPAIVNTRGHLREKMVQEGKVVVFGSIVQDLISYTPRFPRPGESVRGTSFLAGSGGKGANQAVAVARLGGTVEMIGRVGADMFGDSNISNLRAANVCVKGVEKSEMQTTATATITVSEEGENSIVVVLGANRELDASTADRHREQICSSRLLLCQAEITEEGNKRAMQIAKENGVQTFFNPAPGDPNMDKSVLQYVDIICTNENEAEFITGIAQNCNEDAEKAAQQMLTMGPHTVIVTLGSKGVVLARKGEDGKESTVHIPVDKVQAVDTTGAGDCFCGSLAYFLTNRKDLPIEECVKRSSKVAAISVTRKGTQCSYQTKDELEKEHKELFE